MLWFMDTLRRNYLVATGLAAALLLAACHEIPQDFPKPYASTHDVPPYDGSPFMGDQAAFEKALAARAQKENEYNRMGDARTP